MVFKDNGKGSFVSATTRRTSSSRAGRRSSASATSTSSSTNPLYRDPFLRVFVWTIVFATLTVFFSFAVGLFLAIALDKKGLRVQRLYRSVLVMPYAMPGFLSLLVWAGLLNDDFGVVNGCSHLTCRGSSTRTGRKVS